MLTAVEKILFILAIVASLGLAQHFFRQAFAVIRRGEGSLAFDQLPGRVWRALDVLITQRTVFRARAATSLLHDDREPIAEMLDTFAEPVLRQYVESAMQEATLEDRLCACLTLAEQMQLLAHTIPASINEQLLVWFQTYLSGRMRRNMMDGAGER